MSSNSPSDRLRVGFVLRKFPRLSETFILDEILACEERGVDVSVFALRKPDDGRFHTDLARMRGSVVYLSGFRPSSVLDAFRGLSELPVDPSALGRALRFVERLDELERAEVLLHGVNLARAAVAAGIRHLHAHFVAAASHAAYVAHLLTGLPFTLTAHAIDVYTTTIDRAVYRELAAAAETVVTVCEANRRYLREHVLGAVGCVACVYNGVFLDRVHASSERRREPGLVLAVGRLVYKKGFHVLLEAAEILAGRGIDFRCVVVGNGEEAGALETECRRLGLESLVDFAGALRREDVYALMEQARVLAAPSVVAGDGDRDALPNVLLEALALELPIVTTPVGGIPEIVDDGAQGFLVPPGDAAALAEAIERLLTDDTTWKAFARACRKRAGTRFDRRRTIEGLIDLFARGSSAPGEPVAP